MRATEFDFRTQLRHSMEEMSHCSPPNYQSSPASSPEMPYQEPMHPAMGNVRFQYPTEPTTPHQVFFTPYNIGTTHELTHGTSHTPATYSSAAAVWDSWPAPNVIHLNPSSATTLLSPQHSQAVSQSIANLAQLGHSFLPIGFTHHNNINNTPTANTTPISHDNTTNNTHSTDNQNITHNNPATVTINSGNNVPSALSVYDMDYGLGMVQEPSHEDLMGMYNNAASVPQPTTTPSLPAELQYCFDHPQQSMDSFGIDPSGVNIANLSANLNMGMSMGLLNLDMPSLYPLDL